MLEYQELQNWKYRVEETFTIQTVIIPPKKIKTKFSSLNTKGKLKIYKGFCWDGASGALDTENIMLASCLHDALCNWMEQELLPYDPYWKLSAELLRSVVITENMSKMRANYIYKAIIEYGKMRYGVKYS